MRPATTCGYATVSATNWPNITVSYPGSLLFWTPPVCPPSPSLRRCPGRRVPDVDPASSIAPRRMTIARGFARYLAGIDARTEVPPPGLISGRRRWRPPFIYSPDDIAMLMAQARRLRQPMPAATHETLFGLLAVTGMRVGEAIRLDRGDIDWARGVLAIRESKFGKSRRVPVLESTLTALDRYARIRDQFFSRATSSSFLLSTTGTDRSTRS